MSAAIAKKARRGVAMTVMVMALLLFVPAGTLDYAQA